MDPLSSVLSLVKIHNHWTERFEWGREWCLEFAPYRGIRIYVALAGECWLSIEGSKRPVMCKSGDCLLLPSGRPFRVGSDVELPAIDVGQLAREKGHSTLLRRYAGKDFVGLGSHFTLSGDHAKILTGILPEILHIRNETDKAVLRWTLDRLSEELRDPQPGGSLVTQQLSTMLLVQALRVHLSEAANGNVGWMFALADRRIRIALTAMHEDPTHRWTVQSLGERAGMSRTSFAVRFKTVVGKGPLEYLTGWRIMLACDRLLNSKESIAIIAASIGYESETAFSTAFKRVMKCSPRQYSGTTHEGAPTPQLQANR